jgi:hypothetical protein
MKTPSRTFIVIVLAVIATVSVVVFQACSKGSGQFSDHLKFTVEIGTEIGTDKETFAEFKDNPTEGKDRFDAVLRKLPKQQYSIRYKKDDLPTTQIDPDYSPPPKPDVSLKTDNVTIAAQAKNEPIGDPSITKKFQSNDIADIQEVVNSLKN